MSEPEYYLAVDGGGSKTKAWIAACHDPQQTYPKFEIIAEGESGPGNPRSAGFEKACHHLESAATHALERANLTRDSIAAACLSLAGAGREEERSQILGWAQTSQLAQRCIVVDDVAPIVDAAIFEQRRITPSIHESAWSNSVALIVGTGSFARGVRADGISARVGGWGYLLGDEGSGYAIGLEALQTICQYHDSRTLLTPLQTKIMVALQLSDPSQLVRWIYRDSIPRSEIASVGKIVLESDEHDAIARQIVNRATMSWVDSIAILLGRLSLTDQAYALALSGGVLKNQPTLVVRFLDELHHMGRAPSTSHIVQEPLYGGLVIAHRMRQSI